MTDFTTPPAQTGDFDDETLRAIAEVYNSEGDSEYRKGEYSSAIDQYTEGIKVNCKDEILNATLFTSRATVHLHLGNSRKALSDAEAAKKFQPGYIKAIEIGASACVKLNLFEEAIKWCDEGLATDNVNKTLLEVKDTYSKNESACAGKTKISTAAGTMEDKVNHRGQLKELLENGRDADAYYYLGTVYFNLGNFKKAIECYQCYLSIAEDDGNKSGEGTACGNLGVAYRKRGDFSKAIEYHQQQLNIAKETGDRSGQGRAYGNLGIAHDSLGHFKKGLEYHQLDLGIAKEIGDKAGEGSACGNIGISYGNLGDFKTAIEYHQLHLNIAKELGDKRGEGCGCGNLGNAYIGLGDFKKAIEYLLIDSSIAKEFGDRLGEGATYGNLGIAYCGLGDLKTAIEYHQLQLNIAKGMGDLHGEGRAYGSLGNAYDSLGDFKTAILYHEKSLSIATKIGDKAAEANAYAGLGNAYNSLGNLQTAVENFNQHLTIVKDLGDRSGEGGAYCNLGTAYNNLGNFEKAIEHYHLALNFAKEVADKARQGGAYWNLGNAHYSLGDYEKAKEYHYLHLSIAKDIGDNVGQGIAYWNLGNAHFALGELCEAEKLYQSSVNFLDDVRGRLQSKDEWKIILRDQYNGPYSALWRVLLRQNKIDEALFAAERGRGQALMDLMESRYGLQSTRSGCNEQTETIPDILRYISSKTVFLAIGKNTVNLWVLYQKKIIRFVQKTFEKTYFKETAISSFVALNEDVYSQIGVLNGVKCEDRTWDESEEKTQDQRPREKETMSSEDEADPLRILYDLVIGPIADVIHGNDEITIVPDGPLLLAPFAAFKDRNFRYLSETFAVRLLPTLTSLKMMATCPEDYHSSTSALLVGDPWVESVRIEIKEQNKGKKKGKKKGKEKLKRLPQLPDAKEEVEMIGTILGIEPLTGKEATKEEVLRRLPSVALVHIAAHGKPETGEIALSPNCAKSSEIPKEEDYLLTMKDVQSIRMQAKLVVLSCCHSGRGEIKAEGVVGIARAFLGVGARSVLASLWAISDEATRDFMRHFYSHLAEGLSASKCLNQAMKVMRESDRFSRVEHWAPFVLIGDDVTLDFGPKRIPKSEPLEQEAST